MMTSADYFDDVTVFEEEKTFREVIMELEQTDYLTAKERVHIFMALCKDLADTYLLENEE